MEEFIEAKYSKEGMITIDDDIVKNQLYSGDFLNKLDVITLYKPAQYMIKSVLWDKTPETVMVNNI